MENNDISKPNSLILDSDIRSREKNSIHKIKIARKQIECDTQLLSNRIALLQQEQLKTLKKIEESKIKAKEIILIRKLQEDKQLFVKIHIYFNA